MVRAACSWANRSAVLPLPWGLPAAEATAPPFAFEGASEAGEGGLNTACNCARLYFDWGSCGKMALEPVVCWLRRGDAEDDPPPENIKSTTTGLHAAAGDGVGGDKWMGWRFVSPSAAAVAGTPLARFGDDDGDSAPNCRTDPAGIDPHEVAECRVSCDAALLRCGPAAAFDAV